MRSLSSLSRNLKHYKLEAFGSKSRCAVQLQGSEANFEVITDLPKLSGGSNAGPQPIEYLLASLVGCEQATAMFVARHMKFTISGIKFELEAYRDQTGALHLPIGSSEVVPESRLQKIFGKVILDTSASQEEIDRLKHEVEIRCPVANMVKLSGCIMDVDWLKKRL